MAKNIFQVNITLKGSKPNIWRRLLVPSDILLPVFHDVIQIAMGWENAHLHQFIDHELYYSPKTEDDDWWDENLNVDYRKVKLSQLLQEENDQIIYEYDFGDGWNHIITLEKILPGDESMKHPVCLAGKMCCPPEDCGGVWGYADMLEYLKNPEKSGDDRWEGWVDEDFNPKDFDLEEVNEYLKSITFKISKT